MRAAVAFIIHALFIHQMIHSSRFFASINGESFEVSLSGFKFVSDIKILLLVIMQRVKDSHIGKSDLVICNTANFEIIFAKKSSRT